MSKLHKEFTEAKARFVEATGVPPGTTTSGRR